MTARIELPDLPELPISLSAPRLAKAPTPWHLRLRDVLTAYLPLMLMAMVALGTWWLVKNTPTTPGPVVAAPVRHDPDYTMSQFAIERFDRTGRLQMRLEGDTLRHYPDTGRYEVDNARIIATSPDGSVTRAVARRAIGNGELSEVQLVGGAEVRSERRDGDPVDIRSEFLHAFIDSERVSTNVAVRVRQGADWVDAAGLDYDHGARQLDLKGPLRARLASTRARP